MSSAEETSSDEEILLPNAAIKFDELSDVLISAVLEKLPLSSVAALSCTNKRMHRLCHDPHFWSSVRISDASYEITPYNIAVLCSKGAQIRHLCIDLHTKNISKSTLRLLSASCPSVISLSLYLTSDNAIGNNVFPIEELLNFIINSKSVRSLHFVDSTLIDDYHLQKVAPHLQSIREIDLSGCISLTDSTLIKLAQQCPSLQTLDISRLPITGRCFEQIFRYCGGIKTLRANNCSLFQTDSFLSVQPDSLRGLVELSVIGTPVSLEAALPNCTNIRALLASTSLHDSILIPFLIKNRRLEVLYMGSGCRVTIAALLTAIQSCGQHLTSITFHPMDNFAVPSDETVRLICQNCKNLKHLSFAHSREISTFWIVELLKRLPLESLALFGWKNGNSSSLRLIAPHIGNLKMLCMTECSKVTPQGLVRFILECPGLKIIKFEETGANLPNGTIAPVVLEQIRPVFPAAKETSPGLIFLQ